MVTDMKEHIDVDVSGILRGNESDQAADAAEMMIRVCNGRWTCAKHWATGSLLLPDCTAVLNRNSAGDYHPRQELLYGTLISMVMGLIFCQNTMDLYS